MTEDWRGHLKVQVEVQPQAPVPELSPFLLGRAEDVLGVRPRHHPESLGWDTGSPCLFGKGRVEAQEFAAVYFIVHWSQSSVGSTIHQKWLEQQKIQCYWVCA